MSNIFPIDFEEKLTMAQDDYILFSDSEDWNKIKKAQYKNLKWEPGTPWTPWKDWEDWAAATITVGSTTTWAAGSNASVTNSWTSSAAVFNFTIPQWAKWEPWEDGQDWADGAAATITVWTTTTLPAWSSATVTNVWTSQDAILNFWIPKGDAWTWSWDVNWPASSTDWDVALFDWATGKLIKDSWVSLADYQEKLTAWTNIQISAGNVISATWWSDIVYATQAEYNALLPWALTDGKHYFIYASSSSPRLPAEYQEVEYIQSDGNQWIDTWFYPTWTSELDISFYYIGPYWMFWVDSWWQVNAFSLFHDRLVCYWTQVQPQQTYMTPWTNYHIIFNSSKQCIVNDEVKYTYNAETFTSSYSAYVFSKRRNNSVETAAQIRLFSLKLSNNSTLERDFVPCYRKSDSVIWLYDLVWDQFYTNIRTWTFIKWPDVN